MMGAYRVDLTPDDNGTLLVTCGAFPEVTTFGQDEDDARRHAVDAIEEAIAARIDAGDDVPAPATGAGVRLPLLTVLKVDLYNALKREGITRAELGRRLGWKREAVDRLFRIEHQSRVSQIEAALAALRRRADVRITSLCA